MSRQAATLVLDEKYTVRKTSFSVIAVLAGFMLFAAHVGTAQTVPDGQAWTCTFTAASAGTWTAQGAPEIERKTASLTLVFDKIDLQEGSARVTGAYAANDIIVKQVGTTLHFLNVGSSGPVALTTVFDSSTNAGRQKAVHSRHDYVESTLPGFKATPEQYYGECEKSK
jgi:hypothetical protein